MRTPTDDEKGPLYERCKAGDCTAQEQLRLGWSQTVALVQRKQLEQEYGPACDELLAAIEILPATPTTNQIGAVQQQLQALHQEIAGAGK